MDIAGLDLVVPSSVAGTGVSVSASGKVTFSGSAAININGCFSAAYDSYLIVTSYTKVSGGNVFLRYRAAGSDATAGNYNLQYWFGNDTSLSVGRLVSQDTHACGSGGTSVTGNHIYVVGPYLAQPTLLRSLQHDPYLNASFQDRVGVHTLSTSYDGCTIYGADGLTGTLTIYGLSQ